MTKKLFERVLIDEFWGVDEWQVKLRLKIYSCYFVMSGTPKHEETSWAAFESVFKYFAEKLSETAGQAASDDQESVHLRQERDNTPAQQTGLPEETEHQVVAEEQSSVSAKQTGNPDTSDISEDQDMSEQKKGCDNKEQEIKIRFVKLLIVECLCKADCNILLNPSEFVVLLAWQ